MLVLRRCTISLVTLAVSLGGMAAVAHADDAGVRAAIRSQDHALNQSSAIKKLEKKLNVRTSAQAMKAIKLLSVLITKLDHAAGVVSKATASTAQGRAGKTNWVSGARGLAHGLSQLVIALKDIEHGNKAAAQSEALVAVTTLAKAGQLGLKAEHQLKLPNGA